MSKIKIALISCVSMKESYPCPAKELYRSPLFKKTWDYVIKIEKPRGVYILSALYGLIRYDTKIDPYDKTLLDMSKEEAQQWADKVKLQLNEAFCKDGRTLDDYEFVLFAGSKYYENLLDYFPNVILPLGKLPIGKRLGVLSSALKSGKKIVLEDIK